MNGLRAIGFPWTNFAANESDAQNPALSVKVLPGEDGIAVFKYRLRPNCGVTMTEINTPAAKVS